MKQRQIFLLPTVLLPYLSLGVLCTIFLSTTHPLFKYIMENWFNNNALYLIAILPIFGFVAIVLTLIYFIINIHKSHRALSLAKTAMIIKLIQIPTYIVFFVLGVILSLTPFGFGFTFGLIILDYFTLILTGIINITAVVCSIRQHKFTFKEIFWVIILQFFFCLDIIASIIFFIKLKKQSNPHITNQPTA